jgi:hypothetical protein
MADMRRLSEASLDGFLPVRRRFGIIRRRPLMSGGRCSQGGVKLPTGGKGFEPKPASAFLFAGEGSADSVRFRSRRLKSG